MTTQYIARILWLIPAANQATYNTWVKNNLDPVGGEFTFTGGYSTTGTEPAQYYVACGAYTLPELKKIVVRLCALSNITVPSTWDSMTRAEKWAWFRSKIPNIKNKTGIKCLLLDDNDGVWSDYGAEIAAAGLQPIAPIMPTMQTLAEPSQPSRVQRWWAGFLMLWAALAWALVWRRADMNEWAYARSIPVRLIYAAGVLLVLVVAAVVLTLLTQR